MNPQDDKDQSTFAQEMPDTTSSVPVTIEGEGVRTNPTPEATEPSKPMIRRDENGRAIVDFSDRSRKTLAICALILSICSVLLSIVWPIAALMAIASILFGIIALVKKHGGKGMSIASLVIGGISLFILVPFWALVTTGFLQVFQTEFNREFQSEIQRQYDESEEDTSDIQSI